MYSYFVGAGARFGLALLLERGAQRPGHTHAVHRARPAVGLLERSPNESEEILLTLERVLRRRRERENWCLYSRDY